MYTDIISDGYNWELRGNYRQLFEITKFLHRWDILKWKPFKTKHLSQWGHINKSLQGWLKLFDYNMNWLTSYRSQMT